MKLNLRMTQDFDRCDLGTVEQGCAHTYDENIGDSDHRMVAITVSSSAQLLSDTRMAESAGDHCTCGQTSLHPLGLFWLV